MKKTEHHTTFLRVVVLLFFVIEMAAQHDNSLENILGSLAIYTNSYTPEKIYVQTDKDVYTNVDTIWFKVYLINGVTHTASTMSQVVYVELLDSKENIIAQQKLYLESYGAFSDIKLSNDIKDGIYTLRAYTKYILNDKDPILFQKDIPISSLESDANRVFNKTIKKEFLRNKGLKKETVASMQAKPLVQFFPEGGDLVMGIESVLAAKITDSEGNGLAIEGNILDQNGLVVSYFNSYEFGLGWCSLKVKPEADYYLQIPINGEILKYPLPPAISKGYTLRVMNREEFITITASTNIPNGLQGAVLVGHIRGDVIFKQVLKNNEENSNVIKLFTSKLQDGIAHFTLFAPNGEPVSERLTFIENSKNKLRLSVKTDKQDYVFRNKVNVDLTLVDHKGKPLNGNFSMSVFTQNDMQKNVDNIKSWLLLNSDLGGTIANSNYFFRADVKGRKYLLDLLMLTHGWRRFTWKFLMNGKVKKDVLFPPEKGIMVSGKTAAFNNKYQPRKALVTLNIIEEELLQEKKMTTTQGEFSFGPFFFEDSIKTVLNASSIPISKKKKDRLSISLDSYFPDVKVETIKKKHGGYLMDIQSNRVMNAYSIPYTSAVEQNRIPDFEYNPSAIKLDEAIVKARKKPTPQELLTKKMNARTLYGEPSNRLIPDSIPGLGNGAVNTFNVLRRDASVRVQGTFPNQQVFIRPLFGEVGGVPPLYLLDGTPVSAAHIQNIRVSDISFIDVLKGADATIYGGRASGGVVAVYMKRGEDIQQKSKVHSGVANITIPGFYKTREFYKPNYNITLPKHKNPDYRRTLHWEPDIKIKKELSSKIDFYTGDSTDTYVIRVEGVTYDGRPVNALYNFNVLNTD